MPPANRPTNNVLALACVGIAVTAGTYATLGVGTPARVGLYAGQGRAQDRTHDGSDGRVVSAVRAPRD